MRELKLILVFVAASAFLIAGLYFYSFKERLNIAHLDIQNSRLKTAEIYDKLQNILTKETPQQIQKKDSYSLLFVGDVMLSRGVDYQIRKSGNNYKFPLLKVAEPVSSADLLFGNLEGPISKRGQNQGSQYSFRADPRVVEGLKFAGFDVMSLANNHIMDWGRVALEDTLDTLLKNSIHPAGAGRNYEEANNPLVIAMGDLRLAFLAYTNLYPKNLEAGDGSAGISSFDLENIKKTIFNVRDKADVIIISLHWGEEYAKSPNISQKKLAHELINSGVDLIIGHHPHVVQKTERYKQGWIFYSLGNFVFDQNFSEETMQGLMAKVTVENGKISKVEEIKVSINNRFQPEIVSD